MDRLGHSVDQLSSRNTGIERETSQMFAQLYEKPPLKPSLLASHAHFIQ